MNIRNPLQLRHLVVLVGAALWSASTPLAAADAPNISVNDATVVRPTTAEQAIEFIITRSGDTSDPITVGYRTQDGTAKAGTDYTAARGVVTIAAGAESAKVQVPVLPGQKPTPQDFVLQLTGASGPLVPGADLAGRFGFATGGNFIAPIQADFNSDGRLDLAGLDEFNTVSIFLNTTAQGELLSLAPRVSLALGDSPYIIDKDAIKTADFNEDGKPDLAIVLRNDTADAIAVLINNTPKGAFTPQFAPATILNSVTNTTSMVVADFDGDEKADIAVANGEFNVVVFLNTTLKGSATVTFEDRKDFSDLIDDVSNLVATDLNGDNKTDFVLTSVPTRFGANSVFFLLNTTGVESKALSFMSAPTEFIGGTGVGFDLIAADVNGDGRPELFLDDKMFLNTTLADTLLPSFDDLSGDGFVTAVTDIDADGRPDLVRSGSVSLNETAEGATTPRFAEPFPFDFSSFAIGDLNGDGKQELLGIDDDNDTLLIGVLPFRSAQLSKSRGVGTIQPSTDTTPKRFSFIDRFGVARGQPLVSNVVFVRGINQPAPVTVNGGSYSINNGPYVTGQGLVNNGDRVRVALFSATQFNTAANAQLSIGGVSDVFSTRTRGPLFDVLLSRLFGFDFLNQLEIAMASLQAPAMP